MNESKNRINAIQTEIQTLCGRISKLDTLPEKDRRGKYRKAIEELFTTLRVKVREYLGMMAFGRMWIGRDAIPALEKDWYRTDEFKVLTGKAWERARAGDFTGFISLAKEIRTDTLALVQASGGKEYEEEEE